MPGTISYQNRFPLPANWNVEETICCVVRIPRDPEYIAIFRGLLESLTWQRSFTLHPTENAAYQVSKTWERALARNLLFGDCEDIIMAFDQRVKPGQPWIMQASTDGGVTWHDALIQANWSANITAMTLPSTSTAAADLSAQVLKWLQGIMITINDGIALPEPKAATVQRVIDSLSQYGAGAVLTPAIESVYDAAVADAGAAASAADDCEYIDAFQYAKGTLEGAGAGLYQQLSTVLGNIDTQVTNGVSALLFNIAKILGAAAVRDISQASNPTATGAAYGGSCAGAHTFDFTTGAHGWSAIADNAGGGLFPIASYTAGVGWEGQWLPATGTWAHIGISMTPAPVTEVVVSYQDEQGHLITAIYIDSTTHSGVAGASGGGGATGGPATFDAVFSASAEGLEIAIGPTIQGAVTVVITQVVVHFVGMDPF